MERFAHGGDLYNHPGAVDFSANLNPLGMPQAATQALRERVDAFARYPDPASRELTAAIAAFEQVDASWVLVCAGATDAITRLCQVLRPARALVLAPCYSGYEQALEQVGAAVEHKLLRPEDDFSAPHDLPLALDENTKLVFLANPNNPTGRLLPRETLLACLARAREVGATVVLDECFVDLTGSKGSQDLLADHPHLVLVKALTKTFAFAGLRVGYALSVNAELLARLRAAGQPWAVSVPAQVAGVACLACPEHLARGRELVRCERERLAAALTTYGLHVVPGEANYLLFYGPCGLYEELLARDVLIRRCDNYVGLGERWYRVAVRLPHENDLLIRALEEVLPCAPSR